MSDRVYEHERETAPFAVDPDAFVALRHDDALVGTGSVYSYDGAFGFMGLFVLLTEHRGQGVGGVLPMVPFYEKGGFVTAHEDVRWSGLARGEGGGDADPAAVDLASVPFEQAPWPSATASPRVSCAPAYDGPPPAAPVDRCFGVTSLEFG